MKISRYIAVVLVFVCSFTGVAMANWVFDPSVIEPTYYADQNRDVLDKLGYNDKKLLDHWGNFGIKEGRRSSPVFDVKYYLKSNPDLAKYFGGNDYVKAAEHWYKNGRNEGRPSHPDFNVKRYLQLNQDVARELGQSNYLEAIEHYLRIGYKQGKKAN